MYKKIISFLLLVLMITAIAIPTFAVNDLILEVQPEQEVKISDVKNDFSPEELEEMDKQEAVNIVFNELLSHFPKDSYPDDYCGSYYDGSDKLIVIVTSLDSSTTEKYEKMVSHPDILSFELGKYSQNYLEDLCEKVYTLFTDNGIEWSVSYADDQELQAVIGVPETVYDKAISTLLVASKDMRNDNLTDNELSIVRIEKCEKMPLTATLQGGGNLRKSSASVATLAFCGTYSNSPAIITCGHGGLSQGTSVYINSSTSANLIGTVSVQQYTHNGNGDYSITKVTGSHTSTNNVQYNQSGTTYPVKNTGSRPAKNTTVYNYGKNGYGNCWTVTDTSITINHGTSASPFYVKQMVYCANVWLEDAGVVNGDSGGPVYSLSSNQATAYGMLSTGGDTNMGFCPFALVSGFTVKTN